LIILTIIIAMIVAMFTHAKMCDNHCCKYWSRLHCIHCVM